MKEILESIKEDLKEVKDSQKETQKDISHLKEDVKIHIYRTDLLEESVKLQRSENQENFRRVDEEIKPIQRHVSMVKGAAALVAFVLTVLTILSLLKII